MAQNLKKFREIVFQLLYSRDFEKSDEDVIASLMMRQHVVPQKLIREAKEKAGSIWEKRLELDEKINSSSTAFDFEKISRVELAILRLGYFELLHTDLPGKVAIAEAVRLTRKFGTKESANFINALLDKVYHEQISEEPATV